MNKKIIVLSLGGSLIFPKEIDEPFLEKFKKVLKENFTNYKFVVVCGGGYLARQYISALEKENKNKKELALAGIKSTRLNAKFMMQFFGKKDANDVLPKSMKQVKNNLRKNSVVFCGALRYSSDETSDGTAVKMAKYLKTDFVNLTDVNGLYDSDPKKNKKAKIISGISAIDFHNMVKKIKFRAGQHFVLDQESARLIKEKKIKTFILGKDMENFNNFLKNKNFVGTTIN